MPKNWQQPFNVGHILWNVTELCVYSMHMESARWWGKIPALYILGLIGTRAAKIKIKSMLWRTFFTLKFGIIESFCQMLLTWCQQYVMLVLIATWLQLVIQITCALMYLFCTQKRNCHSCKRTNTWNLLFILCMYP